MTKNSKSKERAIGISLFSRAISFHQWLEKGLIEAGQRLGYKIVVCDAVNSRIKQEMAVEEFISRKFDAIVLSPVDSFSVGGIILKANKAGIPVFTMDTPNMSNKGNVVTHISSDNHYSGKLAGRLLAKAIKYKGNVAILSISRITSCLERIKGFKEVIQEFSEINIVEEIYTPIARERIREVLRNHLKKQKKLKGIFATSDETAISGMQVLKEIDKLDTVFIVGHDATPEVKSAIRDKKIYADIRQFPHRIGRETIEAVNDYFQGVKLPPVIYIEVGIFMLLE